MARGFLSGVIWGAVVGLGVATVASVVAPPPQPPTVSADAPGSASVPVVADDSGAEGEAVVTEPPATAAEAGAPAAAPDPDTLAALTEDAQAPGSVPQAGGAADLSDPAIPAEQGGVTLEGDAPVLPNPQALAPMEPQPADDVSISTEPAQPPVPQPEDAESAFDPAADTAQQVESAPTEDASDPARPAGTETAGTPDSTPPVVAGDDPQAPAAPQVDAGTAFAPPAEESGTRQPQAPAATPEAPASESPVLAVDDATPPSAPAASAADDDPPEEAAEEGTDGAAEEAPRVALAVPATRPQIGTPAISLTDRDSAVTVNRPAAGTGTEEAATAAPEMPDQGSAPPVSRYAQDFENPDGKPLMSIVLIDDGTSPTAGAAGIAALRSFPSAITFAVDAGLPDAAERVALYRAAGFEVLAMVDLPGGARASDAETALNAILSQMTEVVGVLEGVETGLQENRATSDQVTAILSSTGHGLLTQNRGLNTMPKLARKEGVPAAAIFRDFDSKGQSATVIRRFLDQAAFKAGQEGAVVMLGRLRPDTISALLLWGLQDRAGQVAIAPVSAILLGGEDG